MPETPATPDTLTRLARALGEKYEVRRLVGHGGFAEVYEVWDRDLERRLAVKVLRPDVVWTAGMLARFKQETRAIARLEHPNILAIHFVGEGEGLVYYAMPFVEGQSLGDLLRRSGGALTPDRALTIAVPVLDALQHAHQAGLLHRDIKPDNIMLDATRGRPLLVDFGIAKRLDAGAGLTQTGFVVGTPHYMSPEQALGDPKLDRRSDLYSMGAVLFQMVTGSPPFDGESSQDIVGKHIAEPPPAAADLDPRIPRRVSDVIKRCLAKQPADRFQSAAEVIAALEADHPRVSAVARTELVESAKPVRPRRGRRVAVIALPVLVVAGAFVWFGAPRLVFRNRLAAPVVLQFGGEERLVEPGARVTARLPRGRGLQVTWTLVPPTRLDGASLGVPLADTVAVSRRLGRVRLGASARAGSRAYFAPLITNETDRALKVTVNAGLQGALPCACTVAPGASRAPIGYYPLFANSTVRVEDSEGRSAEFRDLGSEVERESGVVRLRFRAGDLR